MSKYFIEFEKSGYMVYTSHLDLIRLFKRAFNRADLPLKYSQGFNPHPKLGFAQPLPVGYESICELMEFETIDGFDTNEILKKIANAVPSGIRLKKCEKMEEHSKSLSSKCIGAEYIIRIKSDSNETLDLDIEGFLSQNEIFVEKKVKVGKRREYKAIDIKNKIKNIELKNIDNTIIMSTKLDAGSTSNLSPELLLKAMFSYFKLDIPRENIEISRIRLILSQ